MPYITDHELEALFSDAMDIDTPEHSLFPADPPSYPLKTFHPFACLPAELRNIIYDHYMDATHATNPIRINASGSILHPALTNTCRQIRLETHGYMEGYVKQRIAKETLRIEAQIQDYNPLPLRTTLDTWSKPFSVPEEKLRAWTSVSFTGPFNFENIMAWLHAPPLANPFFPEMPFDAADLPAFGNAGMFTRPTSVLYAVDQFLGLNKEKSATWRYLARQFLETIEELRGCAGGLLGRGEDEVFQAIAAWHYEM